MNRISNLFARDGFSLPQSSKRDMSIRTRPQVEAMLRDIAHVLHLTRSLKESMLAEREESAY